MTKKIRIEHDSIGPIEVPINSLWGAQTQRSLLNFAIGEEKIPIEIIYALAMIKRSAAIVNHNLGVLSKENKNHIVDACNEINNGMHDNQFPLSVWQTGSGTQTNMNINEVISNIASQASNNKLGSYKPIHPNDHVNRSQSTNDVFPAAIHIATVQEINTHLLPELDLLIKSLEKKMISWGNIIKIGRTHLQDAVPITLGQEVSAWKEQILVARHRIKESLKELYFLPLGGTAIGTGLNAPASFDQKIAFELATLTKVAFTPSLNKFAIMASHDGLVNTMSQIKNLAVSLFKIVNDIRLLSCGPRAGIGEIILPTNEPGSSIMPGKVNPTQCEAMAMVCTQVIALDAAVSMAGSNGYLQMNVYKPLIGFNLLKSIDWLASACKSSRLLMIEGMEPNLKKIETNLKQSLMLVTSLTPKIGYEKASQIAQYAHQKDITLREAANKLGYIKEDDFNRIVDPKSMIKSNFDSSL